MKKNNHKPLQAEHEVKFVFSNSRASVLLNWLKLRCLPDHDFPSSIISSIYYDTKHWDLLSEKINSDYLKTKFRLRWYESMDGRRQGEKSFVEVKSKIGATRNKLRFASTFSGEELMSTALDDPKLLALQVLARKKGGILPPSLFPAFQISYKRYRFLEPQTRCRICIDYDISAPRVNRMMLSRFRPIVLTNGVVEVKGQLTVLPDSLRRLTALGGRKEAFSKYSSCFAQLSGIVF